MSRLSDVISRVVALKQDRKGKLEVSAAVVAARELIDDEDREALISEALGKRIKDFATRASRSLSRKKPAHPSLFPGLHEAYAIDVEGRYVKLTDEMSEMEFARLLEIRKKQIEHDTAHFQLLEQAFKAVQPLWKTNPNMSFGQVCRLLAKRGRAA